MADGKIVEVYFEAWNQHDIPAIMATFNTDGTYTDPAAGEILRGEAIGQYAQGLFDAFPDLKLDLLSNQQADNGMWVAPWILYGTAADGNKAELLGCDFITLSGGKIDAVYGVFNVTQLG